MEREILQKYMYLIYLISLIFTMSCKYIGLGMKNHRSMYSIIDLGPLHVKVNKKR